MAQPLISMQQAGVKRDHRWAVRGLNFTIERGEIVTIVGPNGAGKSTTAKLAIGAISPDECAVARHHGLRVGYVPQKLFIDPALPCRSTG
jgi:zinc transport system ATP-binding protein